MDLPSLPRELHRMAAAGCSVLDVGWRMGDVGVPHVATPHPTGSDLDFDGRSKNWIEFQPGKRAESRPEHTRRSSRWRFIPLDGTYLASDPRRYLECEFSPARARLGVTHATVSSIRDCKGSMRAIVRPDLGSPRAAAALGDPPRSSAPWGEQGHLDHARGVTRRGTREPG